MTTWIGSQASLGDMLNSLVELNHDAISAYESALTRIEREDYRVRARAMVADLRRHLDALKPHVASRTTNVSDTPSPKELLTKGRVVLAGLVGDRAVLAALHKTQANMQEALEAAVAYNGNTQETRSLLQNQVRAVKAHNLWLADHVQKTAEPQAADEVDATMKQRTIARTDAVHKTLASSTDI